MNSEERIRRLFQKVLTEHNGNKSAAAASLDTNTVTFWGWIEGKRGLNSALLKAIDKAGGCFVLPGEVHSPEKTLNPAEEIKNLTVLPVRAAAGAGNPSEDEEPEPKFHIAVPPQYVRAHIDTLLIEGTSMEPTILDKAVVGVNRESADIVQGKIYAVRLPYEGVVVKRLFLDHESRQFVLQSDNKDYRDVRISFDDGGAFICGQVVWVLQSYEKIMI